MNIDVDISVDYLWGDAHFIKKEWGDITYIVGANGTGKSIVAEKLKAIFKGVGLSVRYFGAERLNPLGSKFDNSGYFPHDQLERGLNIGYYPQYKDTADALGQSVDGLIGLRKKLDLQIKIESILDTVFGKSISFEETGGFLNVKLHENGKTYDLKRNESHGLKEIITLLTFLYDDEYNCIILDEPELNLHPQFQQYIMQEIELLAGDPFAETGKKIFVILTHSPYMIDVKTLDDLKNVIVFHRHEIPSYINDYSSLEAYQLQRLERLLLRMNVNQKSFFFADKPVFVEGYIDQQVYNLIQFKRSIPLGALGVSIIDVGGKDEVDIMYSLCRLLNINAFCITDLDALLEGKIRQTANGIEDASSFLAEKGRGRLMDEIGNVERMSNSIIEELISSNEDCPEGELKQFINTLKVQSGERATKMRQRIFLIGVQRIQNEIKAMLSSKKQRDLQQIIAISKDVFDCLRSVNIYLLESGEIENYYTMGIDNSYHIADNCKTDYFIRESQRIEEMNKIEIEEAYKGIVDILDRICSKAKVNTEKYVSNKIGNLIHRIQSAVRANSAISLESLKANPEVQWDIYNRIVAIVDFQNENGVFSCKFKILCNLADNNRIYDFTHLTVAANFEI